MNTWPDPAVPQDVKAVLLKHLLIPFETGAYVKKSIGEKTQCLLWVGKRPMTKRSNSPKLVNINCSLQTNVFVSFILLATNGTLSINLHLLRCNYSDPLTIGSLGTARPTR
jgi:hypothetical protein